MSTYPMRCVLLVLVVATTCAAQQDMIAAPSQPPPFLTCGKYQHISYTPAHCANTCDPRQGGACTANCLYVEAQTTCVADMHEVTEREWQELMVRLHALESKK
jgi:hypothetical protein